MSIPAQGAVGAGNTDATAWLKKRMKAAISDSEAHPEGHPNRTFYGAQAIAYENVLSLLEKENRIASALASPRADSDERTAGEDEWQRVPKEVRKALADLHLAGSISLRKGLASELAEIIKGALVAATPDQPAGAVPDSLRALSEAATKGEWYTESEKCDGAYGSGEDCSEGYLAYSILTDAEPRYGKPGVIAETSNSTLGVIHEESDEDGFTAWDETARANTAFIVAAVNYVRTLLASHPAGQSAGSGVETVLTSDGFSGDLIEVPRPVPAPDSTRTGQGEARLREAVSKALHDNQFLDGWPEMVDPVVEAVLAARPAAPEAQGAWRWTARDGHPIRNGEFGEQWLLTWSEASATYDVACIDNDWSHGEPIKLLCVDAWKWIEVSPGEPPAPPASSGQEG